MNQSKVGGRAGHGKELKTGLSSRELNEQRFLKENERTPSPVLDGKLFQERN